MNNNDRRVRRTRKALYNALFTLLQEKDLSQITVKELTEEADLHRATFYSHYQDIYDLYNSVKNNILNQFQQYLQSNAAHDYHEVYKRVVFYIYENRSFMKTLFCGEHCQEFLDEVASLSEDQYIEIAEYEENKTQIPVEWEYLVRYHVQGVISILKKWAEDDYSLSPDMVTKLINTVDLTTDKAFAVIP